MGHAARWDGRYRKAEGRAKSAMLEEYRLPPEVCDTAFERAAAGEAGRSTEAGRKPHYGPAVVTLLGAVWEAAGYPWSVRLKALLPSWLPWIRGSS